MKVHDFAGRLVFRAGNDCIRFIGFNPEIREKKELHKDPALLFALLVLSPEKAENQALPDTSYCLASEYMKDLHFLRSTGVF